MLPVGRSARPSHRAAEAHRYASLNRGATRYTIWVIKSFKHKGLQILFESGSSGGIQAAHSKELRIQLAALEAAN